MSTPSIVIASAARTAVGSVNGAFGNRPTHELGTAIIKGVLQRAGVEAGEVDEVILGQVLQAGKGQNPACQAAMEAGIPQARPHEDRNRRAGSGPQAVFSCGSVKMGDFKMIDTMIKDGLTDAFHGYHMGITAENVARQWQLTREEQDQFALASQNKAEDAQKVGRFVDQILPFIVKTRKGDVTVDQDEYTRHGATLDQMTQLRPAFDKEGVTAGNASPLNDGAAATLLMSEENASRRGIQPLAAKACAVNKDLGWEPGIVNVNGGAVAIAHPIGAHVRGSD